MSTGSIDIDQGRTVPAATDTAAANNPTVFVADPGPLGLAAFAGTTFVLSIFNSGMANSTGTSVVIGLALFYGGIGQLLAGMWEFRKNNTFGALAFTSFGAFWLSFAYLIRYTDLSGAHDVHQALGVFLLMWTIFTAYMTVAATRVSGAVLTVFILLTLTFIALTVGEFNTAAAATKVSNWTKLGGYIGIVTAVAAWYASMAGVTNSTWGRTVLPTFPLNKR
jgi:succinate-acetate transporter protein